MEDKPTGLANAAGCTLVVTPIASSSPEFVLPDVLVFPLTAQSIASEAYRVTIPAVVQVAMIRSAIEARRERE